MKKSVVLFSGGVESTCVLYLKLLEGHVVYPVYVKCGMPWERFEYVKATELWQETKRRFSKLMPIKGSISKNLHKKVQSHRDRRGIVYPSEKLNTINCGGRIRPVKEGRKR
jgi:7-cyano-7-deazaguanine synthase